MISNETISKKKGVKIVTKKKAACPQIENFENIEAFIHQESNELDQAIKEAELMRKEPEQKEKVIPQKQQSSSKLFAKPKALQRKKPKIKTNNTINVLSRHQKNVSSVKTNSTMTNQAGASSTNFMKPVNMVNRYAQNNKEEEQENNEQLLDVTMTISNNPAAQSPKPIDIDTIVNKV